jgi:hypothetical protein
MYKWRLQQNCTLKTSDRREISPTISIYLSERRGKKEFYEVGYSAQSKVRNAQFIK